MTRQLTLDVNLALKVRVVEDLHGNLLLPFELLPKLGVMNSHVFLQVPARELDLLVLAFTKVTHDCPVANGNRDTRKQEDEEIRFRATEVNKGQDTLDEPWYNHNKDGEVDVVERAIALSNTLDGCVFDSGGVRSADCVDGHDERRVQVVVVVDTPCWQLLSHFMR